MSIISDVADLVTAPHFVGYPATGARLPYVVVRPLIISDMNVSVNGSAIDWDHQFTLYCAAGSVEASYNLALLTIKDLYGKYVSGCTITASTGYIGAAVEGHYESQVTVQLNQGGI